MVAVSVAKADHALSDLWLARLYRRQQSQHAAVWEVLDAVKDPEIPVVSIWDLGILHDVVCEQGQYTVVITPTYSGCPAMDTIKADVQSALLEAGYEKATVTIALAPAWTTAAISPLGRQQLLDYGIAPPDDTHTASGCAFTAETGIRCPRCGSVQSERISEFGSTACKALFRCAACLEPFDYFKPL